MTKQCVNSECSAFLDDKDLFCKICGVNQPEPVKKGFFGRKKEVKTAQGNVAEPQNFEDFRLSSAAIMQQAQQPKRDDTLERLEKIEEKLDVMLGNHNWLLVSIDKWLQGYKQKQEQEDTESNK